MFQNYWHKRWLKNFIVYDKSEERRLILSERFALHARMLVYDEVVLVDSLDDDLVKNLRVMRQSLKRYNCATLLRKHSPLRPFYDKIIYFLYERGIVKATYRRCLWEYQKFSYNGLMDDRELLLRTKITPLKFHIFRYMFYLLAVGWALSSVCFMLELVHYRFYRLYSKTWP